ncbi:MAG TPA: hypothetical protein ENI06_06885 [Spirochaetales bacterium]|nr:hypothetical protein [Spirochaetales bacterium]
MIKWYKKMPIPQINIPVLRDGDSLQLSFSFGTNESLTRVWAKLQAISVNSSCSARLKIERFSIEVKESKSIYDFQMNHFLIKEKRGKIRDLKAIYSQTGPERGNPAILRLAPTHDLHIDFTRLYPYC